ncbi:hypothetical protein N7510_008732 [Penicillium lagena]|uniref:uncharacterized protein n=1 Tax=Penicillium lagena TaxID=94218 RepID=UPI0025405496|nr:uncharacterized protein N7510_008732 [Penicillium lagena]KAJ5605951.1 hypothetical protein N7510_008732 [Penicillium lagena]
MQGKSDPEPVRGILHVSAYAVPRISMVKAWSQSETGELILRLGGLCIARPTEVIDGSVASIVYLFHEDENEDRPVRTVLVPEVPEPDLRNMADPNPDGAVFTLYFVTIPSR